MKRAAPLTIFAALLLLVVIGFSTLTGLVVDWLWFDTLGFRTVFVTTWEAKLWVGVIGIGVSAAWLLGNGLLAASALVPQPRRLRVVSRDHIHIEGLPELLELSPADLPWRAITVTVAAVLSLFVGIAQAGHWEIFLKWLHAVPFGRTDPLFGRDLGFYVFSLPAYGAVRDWMFSLVFLAFILSAGVHWGRGAIDFGDAGPRVSPAAVRQLSGLLAAFFLVKAVDYFLQRYQLLLSDNGIVFGAAYTDVYVRLPLLTALAAVAIVAAALCAANVVARGFRLPVAAVVLVLGASLLEGAGAGVFQSYRVKPDELRLETPYIAHNIAFSRFGFGLDRIESKPFPAAGKLTPELLAANQTTIQNIRWWDPRPLLDTYRQLQEIRLYYDFRDVDIDRYVVNGTYQQVMLAARELNQSRLPPDAQTWINQHFKFTHGIGITMSPVNRFDDEGLPIFYVKDIPPVSTAGLSITRPELYFGEEARNYVVVGGGTTEFDYPKGQENVYTTYHGRDGVSLRSLWRRALFAWHFGDIKLLISGNVTSGSRMLFRRQPQARISRIAPFLRLDRDPYLVVSDGRLIWLQDAYTTSDALPYSQLSRRGGINYIRNAVKIAVDAYDGAVTFYVADPADPVIQVYQRIFPSLFQPLTAMPAALRQHVRYPEDLFILQASMYGTYHMTDPEVFYNKEDLWSFPQESYGGETITMQPYYTIMRLPGEADEEFILMLPMVPSNRDNMIAWLAARCDGPHLGSVIEFAFPKEKLIFGPAQIEARIDQDTTISQQLSLWNQTGSRIIRGNLLVIPIDDALLYFEPLYLRAEKRELPELKRLIASGGDRVVMSQTVESLLAALFAGEPTPAPPATPAGPLQAPAPSAAAPSSAEALTHYRQALDALRQGDWKTFGLEMDALQRALEGKSAPPS
ncbi:MAG: hypothetical protein H6Q33_627 [Deltaproteobacteria bacterium]|nr:hypothetical protein [Deltaproteobacteria bacterium]